MTMAERIQIHKEIEEANDAHYQDWNRALAESMCMTLDLYRAGEIELEDLGKVAERIYEEMLN